VNPSIVNWPQQKDIAHVSGFVNELGCGLVLGDPIRMSREARVGRCRFDPEATRLEGPRPSWSA
jgi:hypothetical protein